LTGILDEVRTWPKRHRNFGFEHPSRHQ